MDKVGEIGIDLVLNKQKFNQEANKIPNEAKAVGSRVSNALNNTANSVGSKITNTLSGIGRKVAAVFSVAAITGFTKKLVQSSAQVQAANSQFEQTFGDLSDSATAAMKKVAEELYALEVRIILKGDKRGRSIIQSLRLYLLKQHSSPVVHWLPSEELENIYGIENLVALLIVHTYLRQTVAGVDITIQTLTSALHLFVETNGIWRFRLLVYLLA